MANTSTHKLAKAQKTRAKSVKSVSSLRSVRSLTLPGSSKPRFFWRVTDSTSHTRLNASSGCFDTGVRLWGHWSHWTSIIGKDNLDAHIDWSHRFTPPGHGDPALFISVTDDVGWAYGEFERRVKRRREKVRINVMSTEAFEWQDAFLENGVQLPVLRDKETGCTFFSSEAASVALGWKNPLRSTREWFAVKFIPAKVVLPEVWADI